MSRRTRSSDTSRGLRDVRESRELTQEEWEAKGRDIVYRQLAMMDRSRKQLSDAMEKREVPEDIREVVLQRFESAGLINDKHFAEVLVRTRFEAKGASRRAIAEELRRKGVEASIAARALDVIDEETEYEAAVEVAYARLSRGGGNPETLYRRTYAALARKGYSSSVCSRAMREARSRVEVTAEEF